MMILDVLKNSCWNQQQFLPYFKDTLINILLNNCY